MDKMTAFEALRDVPLPDLPRVVLDLETTGFDPRSDRIWEIALCRQEGAELHWLTAPCHPGREIPAAVQALCGVGPDQGEGAPPFSAWVPRLRQLLTPPVVLLAHNLSFERRFLEAEAPGAWYPEGAEPFGICTLEVARRLYPDLESRALGALARSLGISADEEHRARGDVQTTRLVWARMVADLAACWVGTLGDLAMWMQRGKRRRA